MSVNSENEEKAESEDKGISTSDGEKFFDPPETTWSLFTIVLAGILFSFWTVRAEIDSILMIVVISIYVISTALVTQFPYREAKIETTEEKTLFIFHRSGVSWKFLVDAILGSAIPILLIWFVLHSSATTSPELSRIIMLVAMLCYVFMVPILPLLGSLKRVGILKTKLVAEIDSSSSEILSLTLDVNPLDGYWFQHKDDSELLDSITSAILAVLSERDPTSQFV
ncbi:MAG: hypothetical protein ACTSU3_04145 [Candidatus Thorarchaeota archaeon]